MILIKRIKNKAAFWLTAAVVLLMMGLGLCAVTQGGAASQVTPASSHAILNRWLNSDGKRCYLNKEIVTEMTVYQATLPPTYTGEYLILKGKHLGVDAYTGGKTLFSRKATYGTSLFLIPVEELDENATVILHLTPYKQKAGKLTADVTLANRNDYLLTMLVQSRRTVVAVLCLSAVLLVTLCLSTAKIKNKKYSGFGDLYLAVFLALWILYLIFRSDLALFTPCSSACCSSIKAASLLLSPVPLISFIVSKARWLSQRSPGRNRRR